MNLRHDTCKISHAYAYRGVQILDYKTYFCAFIPKKLNKLRRLFFIFPITLAVVSEPGKISHLGVKFRGLQCPKKAPRSQNFKIFTVSARLLWPKGRHGASLVPLFCTTMGPLVISPSRFGVIPKILPPEPPGHATSEKVSHFL